MSFQFPIRYTLPAESHLLVVSFDPVADSLQTAAFRAKYGVSAEVPLLGPYQGKLSNGGGRVELSKPDPIQRPPHPDAGFLPMILSDWVSYDDVAPWPLAADGGGQSLHRLGLDKFADDVANWRGGAPTPGRLELPQIRSIQLSGDQVILEFTALAGASYQLKSSDNLSSPAWQSVAPLVAAQPLTRSVSWTNVISATAKSRYFRLFSPAQ